ncbi:50S ribosomal protein L33 [Streptomyces sp. NPDC093065]|uniref:50S ribosomal protein L33 n=1 Tax=Streptomyces sp. NPDC093065 TaxID=3366021 RepID=UPI0038018E89
MARNELRPVGKLRPAAGTGYTYVTRIDFREERTGTARVPDAAGRVERFERRYGKEGLA